MNYLASLMLLRVLKNSPLLGLLKIWRCSSFLVMCSGNLIPNQPMVWMSLWFGMIKIFMNLHLWYVLYRKSVKRFVFLQHSDLCFAANKPRDAATFCLSPFSSESLVRLHSFPSWDAICILSTELHSHASKWVSFIFHLLTGKSFVP